MIYDIKDIPEDLLEFFEPAPQIGLEATPEAFLAEMVAAFRRAAERGDPRCRA